MRVCIYFLLIFLFISVHVNSAKADPVDKKNLGFEKGNFDGWVGYQWRYSTASDVPSSFNTSPTLVSLPNSRRQVIISDKSAFDPNTGNSLKMIPDGYNYSARLGCEIVNSDESPRCWQQSLRYTMSVNSSNAFLLLKFACVLQYSQSHNNIDEMEPHFQLSLYDKNNDPIEDCSNYDVFSSGNMDSEFRTYTPSGSNSPVKWRNWTTVGADLTAYIGQDITIEFLSADCTGHYHYGYAYFVVDCMPLYITVDYCTGDSEATLSAPAGFYSYQWTDESGAVVDSVQNLILPDPKEGETYDCEMISETGCDISLSAEIARYEQEAAFSSRMLDCFSNEVQFTNASTYTEGTLKYLWDFGDGNVSEEKDPVYKFQTSGLHDVSLILYNPPSGCTDTLYKTVESFSPPLIGFTGDTTYCPGLETELTAYGAYSYEWSTGSTSETVSFGAPGGDYWMIGYSTPEEGCVSEKKYFSVSEEPDWDFTVSGDTFLCEGSKAVLIAEGAEEYLWNTNSTSDTINILQEGTYSVSGTNARGCVKKLLVPVIEVPVPKLSFSLSTNTINSRNNSVECKAESDDNVLYEWDMGDGTISNSQIYLHDYIITSELLSYPVSITVTNEYGCATIKTDKVVVEPFVPNVFTPNNDGVNDLFMPGYQIKVFDRNGIVLFTGETGWDGYYKGKFADPDTYFYRLDYTDAYGDDHTRTGFLTLVR